MRFKKFGAALMTLALLLSAGPPAAAKEGALQSNPDSFMKLAVGARPFGMGGAFTAVADDANACYYNPAGLADMKFWELNSMHSDSFDFDITYEMANAVLPLSPGRVIGLSYYSLSTEDIPITRDNVPAIQGYTSDKETAAVFSYGHQLSQFLKVGFNAKQIQQKVYIGEASGTEADLGFLYTPSRTVHFGLNLQDALSTTMRWNTKSEVQIPLTIRGGVAFHLPDWGSLIALDINKVEGRDAEWNGGFEYQFNDAIQGRLGLNNGDPTAGLGFMRGGFRFDYAFQKADLGDTHRFSTGFRFGSFLFERFHRASRRPKDPQCGKYPITKCGHKGKVKGCKSCEQPAMGTANLMTGPRDENCDPRGDVGRPQPDINKVLGPEDGVEMEDARTVDRAPRGGDAIRRGNELVLRGQYDDASALYRDAIKAQPTNEEAHLKLAGINQYQKKYEEAIEEYKDAIAVNPGNLDSYINIANLYAKRKEYDRAAEAASIVIRLAPGTAKAKMAERMYKTFTGNSPDAATTRKLKVGPARSASADVAFEEGNGADRVPSLAEARKKALKSVAKKPSAKTTPAAARDGENAARPGKPAPAEGILLRRGQALKPLSVNPIEDAAFDPAEAGY